MTITSRAFVQSTTALLLVGFLALLGIVGMTFWLGERAQVYFNEVIEARDARGAAVDLRTAVQSAESSQRGFLFSGNEIYLAPYDTATTMARRQLETVNRLLASYKGADVSIQRLTALINEKLAEMDRTIALKRDRRDAEALALFRTNRGKNLMDEANIFFSGLVRAADDRLTTGVGEQQKNAALLRWFSIIGGVVIIVVVGGAASTVLRYTRELAAARDEVGLLNAGLEERVQARTVDLAKANEEIQRFVHIVSHDLRAPLVSIIGFTREFEDNLKPLKALVDRSGAVGDAADPVMREARMAATDHMPEAIHFIRSSANKMDSLISAILKLSREGRRQLRPERVELADVITKSAAAIQHQLSEAGGKTNFHFDVPPLHHDRLSLEQIFGNLLDNAVKYRAKQRPLRIDVRARAIEGDRICVEVSDNGRGIAERDRERVFELFKRSGEQDQPGEGIGLAYVLTVIRNLGGEISMTSDLDRGTTFKIVLPRELHVFQS
ncbi:MAG: CHASE3 domain-containing protein [Bradyrhizobium sp.]|nr:CHASE3 domain-containing protein [Bradyrhizobium sp.]